MIASCGLPRSGPNKREILAGSVDQKGDAFVVAVTPAVARATAVQPVFGFSDSFRNAGVVASDMISSGDTINITVYENVKDEPLLGNTGQRVSGLSEIQVDGQGFIYIPYAGRIKAAGLTPEGLRQAVTRKLEDQTPDPQVSVSRRPGEGSTVSISGQAGLNGVYPIEASTRTLGTMLAKAGGVTVDPAIAIVRVTRGRYTGKIWLNDLFENPNLDIALRAGDKIVVEKDSRKFLALGATGAQSLVPFDSETMSALEAIATVGGLSTMSADPTGVFVLRDESEAIARAVLGRSDLIGDQRIVYVLDLTEPTGLFEARDFMIRDGDTLYVTEAPFVQWQKTLGAITGTTTAATGLANTANTGG
ncbi:polysaccharide biosynthesis/export family protein [Tabrizicola sp.]|uniref:polysaccharide biosynthesis/export family protein n=1 Tax=Tabrizicola sp. TaxID=2005166 RepID=UPI000BCC10B2|nr:polysaccharide biosynthesis/export family protein [Tabrizicola sp.]MBY0352009.1 polysaccharide export protein [Tabrizicola sp.]OYX19391.1 MAG: sugar ABC transporter substrate-binding protein [Rhodobacterales bacterium 32-66-9]